MSDKDIHPIRFLSPRHWPMWLALGFLRTCVALPYRWQVKLGAGLGALLYRLLPSRRRIARTNLELAFPELDGAERERLVQRVFRSGGISIFESGLSWWGDRKRLEPLGHMEGLEHLEAAMARGNGVILLSAHITCLEIGGRLLSFHQPFQVMYKRQRNPLFEAVLKRSRERHYRRAIQRHDVRGMIRGLKEHRACWYAPDQDFGRKNAVFVPFFGVPTATVTATSRFAAITGAAVVPFFPFRREDGSGYDLTLLPALDDFPSGDDQADTARISQLIEQQVRKAPDQYLWLHRRFRTMPEGEKRVYS
ncbi:LpxL/LpxP family Kdo(2)-lipid IV(A) lauroyl/palmitoleoyl acyltransferase [Thiohalomonas denitrificans]|uniref:LpxL/LpxP family Kdo(2)-lipid IV(A) lauroyl/palmitoleoyl acyltransferase n=1 Tax=Thiohalomonas denitrificans TaxID=415747 RepID=UPI0026F23B54|nr:LpxL/LpxP family Kdo(2)-lipid IV(A) lauroyl/palmitoleoyl acyltransferase [Thiohalomonas denitrificans]